MDTKTMRPARLNEDALRILREAEAAINQRLGLEGNPDQEIYLMALTRNRRQ